MDNQPSPLNVPMNETPPVEPAPSHPAMQPPAPKGKSKKKLIGLIILLVLLVAGAAVYALVLNKDESAQSEQTSQATESQEQQFVVPDEWYVASAPEKTVAFYDIAGSKVRDVSLGFGEDYVIGIGEAGRNDSIQVVDGGRRIFVKAGQVDPASLEQLGEPDFKTHEIFEIIDGKPVQVYKAANTDAIKDWVVSDDGELLYIQTVPREGKTGRYTNFAVNVADKNVNKLSDLVEETDGMASSVYISPDKSMGGYFTGKGGALSHITYNLTSGERTVKDYSDLKCSTATAIWCGPEWPESISPDGTYVVYGYQTAERFGVSILDVNSGEIRSEYQLDTGLESIGNIFWASDSSKVTMDVDAFSNEGQNKVGRLNRVMELKVGENSVSDPVFSMPSPGIGDGASDAEAYRNSWVKTYGYSISGEYQLVNNEGKYKVVKISDKSTVAAIDGSQVDSTIFLRWVR